MVDYEQEQVAMILQHTHRAMIFDQDELTVDGITVSTPVITAEDQTTVAIFLGDENANGVGDETPSQRLGIAPFLQGLDVLIPVQSEGPVSIRLNDVTINMPRWDVGSEGLSIVLLDN